MAQAGEQLAIESTGALTRGTVDRRDPRWNWITEVTPPYAIEDRRLSEFLAWVCRETGRELVFASPEVRGGRSGHSSCAARSLASPRKPPSPP